MSNIELTTLQSRYAVYAQERQPQHPNWHFVVGKRFADIIVSVLLLPFLVLIAVFLLVLNPIFNRGPVIFPQIRMGRSCRPFVAYKFRSMAPRDDTRRRPYGPLETDRITPLGRFLRRTRIDELPQILNVLRGEMSLIGPRPDYIHHARHYSRHVPGYRARYLVRPGISGLAQTEIGYVQGVDAVVARTRADNRYLTNLGVGQEVRIFWRTLLTVIGMKGL